MSLEKCLTGTNNKEHQKTELENCMQCKIAIRYTEICPHVSIIIMQSPSFSDSNSG